MIIDILLDGVDLIDCSYCWLVQNTSPKSSTEFTYIDSNGNTVNYPLLAPNTSVKVCGRSVSGLTVVVTKIGRCSACPTTTTTTVGP